MTRKGNRELAERLEERLRPRLVALLAELLEEERGADEQEVPRVPGITPEGYALAAATAARWLSGEGRKRGKKAG